MDPRAARRRTDRREIAATRSPVDPPRGRCAASHGAGGADEAFPGVQLVRCDNRAAGVEVANYLVQLGHTRIAFAGGPRHSIDSKHRLLGLREGLQKHRLSIDPTCVFSCGSYEVAAGDAFARTFFEVPRDLTAIVFANDALASGFMRVAHQRKIRIPEDLWIVGFDGLPEDELLWPALTSVAQPMLEMGAPRAAGCSRRSTHRAGSRRSSSRCSHHPREHGGTAGPCLARRQRVVTPPRTAIDRSAPCSNT